ncbi:MAG: MarR family winged helix-turn-helix transcriptional regulator, partial [Actinocrinis sp.]
LTELTSAALAPYGLSGRELAVLLVLADGEPASQQEAAGRLGIDRTSMVAMVDGLEAKDLVERRPHPADRRRNVVALTAHGRDTVKKATRASEEAEREFLKPLGQGAGPQFKAVLRALIR